MIKNFYDVIFITDVEMDCPEEKHVFSLTWLQIF